MCIALISTAHPTYPLILIDNRDEYLNRPTAAAAWWADPHSHVLGGRDLHRKVQGTWLGVTRQGRIAVLTNFREEGEPIQSARSRGEIVSAFLTTPPDSPETTEQFAKRLIEEDGVHGVGGFSLICGRLRASEDASSEGLAIISNRTPDVGGVTWIAREAGETHGLSNSHFGDRSWPKVVEGEKLMKRAIEESAAKEEDKDGLIARLFGLLTRDTLPRPGPDHDWQIYLGQLKNSIFVPPVGGEGSNNKSADELAAAKDSEPVSVTTGVYGTQQQTVILVDREGNVTFVERTLNKTTKDFDSNVGSVRKYEFRLQDGDPQP